MAPRPTDRTDADATWSRADRGPAPTGRLETLEALVAVLAGSLALSLVTGDGIAGAGILVLASVWRLLRTDEGPPVLAMAVTFQWIQVTAGLYYYGLTGRALPAIVHSDYRPMVLIGLGCVVALALGLASARASGSGSGASSAGPSARSCGRVSSPCTWAASSSRARSRSWPGACRA